MTTLPAVVTIVDLPPATTITGAELLEAVQTVNGVALSVQVPLTALAAIVTAILPSGGSSGQFLQKSGATDYVSVWSSLGSSMAGTFGITLTGSTTVTIAIATAGVASWQIATNAVGNVQFRQGGPLSLVGVAGNATANVADISVGTTGGANWVLQVNAGGTGILFGPLSVAGLPTGTTAWPLVANGSALAPSFQVLTVPGGGLGTSTLLANGVLLGNGTGVVTAVAPATTGFVLTGTGTTTAPAFQSITTLAVTNITAGGGLSARGVGTTGGAITGTGTLNSVVFPTVKTALYTVVTTDLGQMVAFSAASIVTAVIPQATTAVGSGFPAGWYVDLINFGGTTVVIAPGTSVLTGIGATTGLGPNQSVRLVSDATNYLAFGAAGPLALSRTNTAQQFSGGIRITSLGLGTFTTGTLTLDSGRGPLQFLTNNGAFTIAAPSNDGEIDLLVINATSAGAITFSGFSVNSTAIGDTYTTTNTNRFVLMSRTINGSSTYKWATLQ